MAPQVWIDVLTLMYLCPIAIDPVLGPLRRMTFPVIRVTVAVTLRQTLIHVVLIRRNSLSLWTSYYLLNISDLVANIYGHLAPGGPRPGAIVSFSSPSAVVRLRPTAMGRFLPPVQPISLRLMLLYPVAELAPT